MWPRDLAQALENTLKDARIKSVTRYQDLPDPPSPEGLRIIDTDGKVWNFQIVTTSPPGGGHLQTGW